MKYIIELPVVMRRGGMYYEIEANSEEQALADFMEGSGAHIGDKGSVINDGPARIIPRTPIGLVRGASFP